MTAEYCIFEDFPINMLFVHSVRGEVWAFYLSFGGSKQEVTAEISSVGLASISQIM